MIHQAMIRRMIDPSQGDRVFIVNEDLKILPRLQIHLRSHRARQDDLAFL